MIRTALLMLTLGLLFSCSSPSAEQNDGVNSSTRTGPVEETTVTGERTSPSQAASPTPTTEEENSGPETTAPPVETLPDPNGATRSESTSGSPAAGENGMVSSANPLATEAGLRVLADGGNAFDAAVAVAASLGVVEPMMSGIGGYGATVVYDAKSGETRFLGASSRVPGTLDASVFYPPTPGYFENRLGAAAISTPGAVNDWEALWEEYGSLEWERLLEPAIGYAEEGYVLNAENAGWISSEFYTFPANAQEIYGSNGAPLQAGDLLVQEDLGRSLRLISESGAEAIYGGELGEAMAAAAQQSGGFLSTDDLQRNSAEWRPTIGMDYRGQRIATAPPPNTSWNYLTRLGVMSRFDPASLGHNSAAYLDLYARVTEQAFYERYEYAADPEVEPTPLDLLLSEEYWAGQAAAIDPALSSSTPPEDGPIELASATEAAAPDMKREHTTHFVVADREGNVVSMTQTIGNIFGSKVMPEGTGIWLNNSISYARFDDGAEAADLVSGRFRLPGISPTLVLRDGRPQVALGTHGGYYITQTTPQMLMNHIDFGLDIQQSISAPRIAFVEPDSLAIDGDLPAPVQNELASLGYTLFVDEYGLGNAHGLTVEYDNAGEPTRFTGGADPRGGGVAVGF
ncbi:MAG: gamma-glutamyltransferase family protein [Actinomycetota bacterium]|nr:gamma-glutamyltransferase family protein [Actinomycetota bacterium]